METNSKFSKFVAKLEQKMLDGNQESMVLTGILDSRIYGSANGKCNNTSSDCVGEINSKECTNKQGNCGGSSNPKTCTNTALTLA